MKYNGGSSIKNTTNSSFNTSNNINDKLRKLNEELDQLEIAVASLTTGVSSVNAKVGTDDVAHQIEVAKTEISNAISQSVETADLSATDAEITNINADTLTVDNIETTSDRIDILSKIAAGDIYQRYNTIVSPDKALIIHPNSIVKISFSDKYAIVFNSSQGNSIIITNVSDKIRYFVSGSSLYINVLLLASISCIGQTPTITDFQASDFVFVKSGTNVLGPLYANLAQANLQNITITNTLSAKTISAENVTVSEDLTVSGTVHADIDSDNIQADEIKVKDVYADRINSSQIHTKVEKENLGYTIIPAHQSTELYAISVPVTNGLWEIELENSLRATLNKTNSAVEITYWRNSEDSLPIIGIKDDKLFIYTRDAGKVYFSNNTLENVDTTVEIYAPTSPNYPVLEDLDEKLELTTNNGVVNTTTTYVKDLVVTGKSIYSGESEVNVDILSVDNKIIAQGTCGLHNQVLTTDEDGKTVWAYGAGFINGSCENRVATVGAVESYNGCYEANGNCIYPITHIGANACIHGNFVATNGCGDKIQLADRKVCLVNGCCDCNNIIVDNTGVSAHSRGGAKLELDYYGAALDSGSPWNPARVRVSCSEGVSLDAPVKTDESNNCIYNYARISENSIGITSLTACRPEGSPGPVEKGRACIITDPDGEIRMQAGICYGCKSDVVIDCNGLNVTGNLAVTGETNISGDLSANTVTASCFHGPLDGTATNATCFNGCTYSEACIDIRNGLATQVCADAIQDCANFIQSCVSAIEEKIPAQASASNQLADKDFVNSSIATNTANFRGTYACVDELPSTGNTNNDYAFVCSLNTTTGNYIYDRYKWIASNSCWVCEYELNTTGFTAEQLAAINSGITSNLVAKITDVYDNTVTVCMNGACKGSFSLNQNTDVCIDLGSEICNAECFNGCTYTQAKNDIRNGLLTNIAIDVNCDNTCVCTLNNGSTLSLSPNAFNANATISTTTYPGACKTGTVTQVKVGTTAYDPVSGVISLPAYPSPTTVQNATCFNGCTYACAKADFRNYTPSCACRACWADCSMRLMPDNFVTGYDWLAYRRCNACGTDYLVACHKDVIDETVITEKGVYVCHADKTDCATQASCACHSCNLFTYKANGDLDKYNSLIAQKCTTPNTYYLKVGSPNTTGACVCVAYANCAACTEIVCFTGKSDNVNYSVPLTNATTTGPAYLYTSDISNGCPLTFNPSNGVLCAKCFCGKATCSTNADNAGNSTCFGGCTYAQAKANIRAGLGTVSSVNVSVNGVSGTAVTSSGTITLSNVPPYFANNTYYAVGDDSAIGDVNVAGMIGLKSLNNDIPGISFRNSSNTELGRLYVSENTLYWTCNQTIAGNLTVHNSSNNAVLCADCFCGNLCGNAKTATNAASATNATCFNGYTYACAKADIRNYVPNCASGAISANHSCYIRICTANDNSNWHIPFTAGNDVCACALIRVSNGCPLTFNPSTGVLCAKCFCGNVTVSSVNGFCYDEDNESILIGTGVTIDASSGQIAIGNNSQTDGDYTVAVGDGAQACVLSVAIGSEAHSCVCAIAIGNSACACASCSIAIGCGACAYSVSGRIVDCNTVYSTGASAHFCFTCSNSQLVIFNILACQGKTKSPMWPLGCGCTYCGIHMVPARWIWRNGTCSDAGNWMCWDGDNNIDLVNTVAGTNHAICRTCSAAIGARLEIWADWSFSYCNCL